MSDERGSTNPLVDIAAVVISPILVMMMVGSLVFFLITVLYQGQYSDRLLYTFFFFVIGAVLIARISIQFGRARASLYAAGLGGACFIAMMSFVEYPPGVMSSIGPVANLVLMAIVWWSANKLTWDCTHFDEARKASGQGVLAAAGMDDIAQDEKDPEEEKSETEPQAKKKKKKNDSEFIGWWEKWAAYRKAQEKKPHTPGVWVLYFSLAALPLFALGQSLIHVEDSSTRWSTFLQMAVYVGSGLGLLVTTTLFGLKRYLEQRNARLPTVMTMGWLGLGGGLIVVFLAIGAALPRPHSETPWFGMQRAKRSDREASRYAVVKDGSAGKGEGAAGKQSQAGDGKNSAKGGKQDGGKSGEKGSGGEKGNSQGGKSQNGDQKGNQSESNKSGQNSDQSSNNEKNKSQSNSKQGGNPKEQQKGQGGQKDPQQSKNKDPDSGEGGSNPDDQAEEDNDNSGSSSSSSSSTGFSQALEKIGTFVKWIVWIVVAVAVIVGIVVFFLKWLAPFTNWAKNLLDWLRGLFGPKAQKKREEREEQLLEAAIRRSPPFSTFSNPFTDGSAEQRDPMELVEYTFAAFDAWAWDRGQGREPGETPLEFAVRVGHEYEDLDEPAFRMANLFVRVLYSRSPIPKDALKTLETFWDVLESTPITAGAR